MLQNKFNSTMILSFVITLILNIQVYGINYLANRPYYCIVRSSQWAGANFRLYELSQDHGILHFLTGTSII